MASTDHNRLWLTIKYLFAVAMLIFFLFPVYWLILTALKTRVQIFSVPPLFIFDPTLNNFTRLLFNSDALTHIRNSIIAAGSNTILSMLLGTFAAYGVSRFKVGETTFMNWVLGVRMLPPIVGAIPLFTAMASLRLIDTFVVLPVLYLTLNLPFVIWMMKSFFDEVPADIEESARIDGCTALGALIRVVLPLVVPGLVATAVFCFIFAWNEFLFAMLFTRINARTIPVAISGFITAESEVDWGQICAAATLAIIPPVALALALQRSIVRGLTLGAVR